VIASASDVSQPVLICSTKSAAVESPVVGPGESPRKSA
jgi:hypothetical protein